MNFRYVCSYLQAYIIVMLGVLVIAAAFGKTHELTAYWFSTLFIIYQMHCSRSKQMTFPNCFAIAAAGFVVSLVSVYLNYQFPKVFSDPFAGPKGIAGGWAVGLLILALVKSRPRNGNGSN